MCIRLQASLIEQKCNREKLIYGKDSIQERLLYLKLLLPHIEIYGYDNNLTDGDGNPGQKGDEWALLKRK